jgi:cytochrome o ubiquinol oxidase subunit IV
MSMSDNYDMGSRVDDDRPPGVPRSLGREIGGYLLGLTLAAGFTVASFWTVDTRAIYGPGVALALLVLAVAQMGIHLVFFLHITTAPDHSNNILALAFGVLTVCLVVFGSLWVMSHLNHDMVSMTGQLPPTP